MASPVVLKNGAKKREEELRRFQQHGKMKNHEVQETEPEYYPLMSIHIYI